MMLVVMGRLVAKVTPHGGSAPSRPLPGRPEGRQERHRADLQLTSLTVRRCFHLDGAALKDGLDLLAVAPGLTLLRAPFPPRSDELIGARFFALNSVSSHP